MDEQHGYYFEDLSVGMSEVFSKTVTDADIVGFADITGDTNPIHLCEDFASATPFKDRIAHGMLSAGLISAVLGTRLPGPGCVYLSQSLRFMAPVKIGDHVEATATVVDKIDKGRRIIMETVCKVGDTVVIEGEAVLKVSPRPAEVAQPATEAAAVNGHRL
ncbi:MAG: MaoC family dehydratase [Kiloniellales bacterium]|nr:MaoC family dehydratase [Kiloniellales bacterium]